MATYTDNYQLTKPTYAEQADIGVINSNMNKIDDIMHSSQISLAPAYDSTQTYAEGDVVMYELLMYKCISPTTGVWDGSKWERTTASESGGGGSAELDILGEASGAVASFADGASAGLAKCIVEIVPKQAGSGTPSLDNVRAISGSTSVTVTISDGETSTTKTTPLGQTVYGGQLNVLTGELTIDRGFITITSESQLTTFTYNAENGSFSQIASDGKISNAEVMCISNMMDGIAFNNHAASAYVDMDRCYSDETGKIRIRNRNSVTINTKADLFARFERAEICYFLATPQTVQLAPQEVNSLLGQNNISADTGDIDIVYVKASAPIQPNPTGTPTATLKKLGIEGTVFEIPSGGGGSSSGINYSTTEQVIGTWIDGKPLYQRTFDMKDRSLPNSTWTDNLLGTSGITIRSLDGYVFLGDTMLSYDFYRATNSFFTWADNGTHDDISVRPNLDTGGATIYAGIVTIQYTKIAD